MLSSRLTWSLLQGDWVGRRFCDYSSSALCELYAILDAVSLVCQSEVNAAIICDSKPALQSLSAVQPTHPLVVQQILSYVSLMNARNLCVKFLWVSSHVGLYHNATADRLAKEACRLPPRGEERPLSPPATSSGSVPPLSSLHSAKGMQRGPIISWAGPDIDTIRGGKSIPMPFCLLHQKK